MKTKIMSNLSVHKNNLYLIYTEVEIPDFVSRGKTWQRQEKKFL